MESALDNDGRQSALRSALREKFLRLALSEQVHNRPAHVQLHGKVDVKCRFAALDASSRHLLVENLETPLGTVPRAILRVGDVLHLSIDLKH